jgi:hypothetical protein
MANSLIGLNRSSIKGMSEFQMVTACRTLSAQGVHSYNLGGSERQSLDDYKQKFMPYSAVHLRSYDVSVQDELQSGLHIEALPAYAV